MIDPANITNFKRSLFELEEFLLFCIVAAGKNAKVQAAKLDAFLKPARDLNITPFKHIRILASMGKLREHLEKHKLGQYSRLDLAFTEVARSIFPEDCSASALEFVHGVGPKTARFFLVHSRPDQQLAILDTHILRYMREILNIETPKTTPSGKKYLELEKRFLAFVPPGMSVAEFDLAIWNHYNAKTPIDNWDKRLLPATSA